MVHRTFPEGAAIVVGGTGGLGRAICLALGKAGCPVVIGYHRDSATADRVVEELRALSVAAEPARIDLEDEASIEAASAQATTLAGGVAAVVGAAGTRKEFVFAGQVADAHWEAALSIEVRGFLRLARVTLPRLRATRGSLLSITTYQAARLEPRGALSSVPKAAIERATQAIAREEGRYGVRANALRVGWISAGTATNLLDRRMVARKQAEIPLRRVGRPEEVATAACFLVSNEASFITGAALPVDGGDSL